MNARKMMIGVGAAVIVLAVVGAMVPDEADGIDATPERPSVVTAVSDAADGRGLLDAEQRRAIRDGWQATIDDLGRAAGCEALDADLARWTEAAGKSERGAAMAQALATIATDLCG